MKAVVRDTSLFSIVISINKILRFLKFTFTYFLAKKYAKLKCNFITVNSHKQSVQLLDL